MAGKRDRDRKKKINYTSTKKLLENYDSGGFQPTCWNLPSGMKMYKWKKGKNKLDFMPFVVGKNNPNADEGSVHWERTYFVHDIPTADGNRKYPCLAKNFGKKCPICNEITNMKRKAQGDPEAIKKLEAKTRRAFLVRDRLDKDAGIMLLETGHFKSFGALMQENLMALDDDSVFLDFYHLEDGATVNVTGVDDSFMGRSYVRPAVIQFEPRKTQYSDSDLDDIPCLDALLKEYDFKELLKIFDQAEGDEDEEEDKKSKPNNKKKPKPKDEDDDDEEEDDEDDGEDDDSDDDDDDGDSEDDDLDEDDGDDDNEEEDDGDEDGDDGEDDEDDEGDDGDGDDESDYVPKVKDRVQFKHKKKTVTGVVVKANKGNEMALVEVKGEKRPIGVPFDELTPLDGKAKKADDEDDEDEQPKAQKAKMGKPKDEDEDEDFEFDEEEEEEEDDLDEDEKRSAKSGRRKG